MLIDGIVERYAPLHPRASRGRGGTEYFRRRVFKVGKKNVRDGMRKEGGFIYIQINKCPNGKGMEGGCDIGGGVYIGYTLVCLSVCLFVFGMENLSSIFFCTTYFFLSISNLISHHPIIPSSPNPSTKRQCQPALPQKLRRGMHIPSPPFHCCIPPPLPSPQNAPSHP